MQLASNVVRQTPNIVETPAKISAAKAFEMAGYGPKDMQFAEFYDCYTVLVAMTLEDVPASSRRARRPSTRQPTPPTRAPSRSTPTAGSFRPGSPAWPAASVT
ncbi:MAG: hypothetical protein U0531_00305 [Dehalococcoidia bacterium]